MKKNTSDANEERRIAGAVSQEVHTLLREKLKRLSGKAKLNVSDLIEAVVHVPDDQIRPYTDAVIAHKVKLRQAKKKNADLLNKMAALPEDSEARKKIQEILNAHG
jgi:hypothetical protein